MTSKLIANCWAYLVTPFTFSSFWKNSHDHADWFHKEKSSKLLRLVGRGMGEKGKGYVSQQYYGKFTLWQVIIRTTGVLTLSGIKMLNRYIIQLKVI